MKTKIPELRRARRLSQEELAQAGANDSMVHVDFMIGSDDLTIVGETNHGEKVNIFENGEWAF